MKRDREKGLDRNSIMYLAMMISRNHLSDVTWLNAKEKQARQPPKRVGKFEPSKLGGKTGLHLLKIPSKGLLGRSLGPRGAQRGNNLLSVSHSLTFSWRLIERHCVEAWSIVYDKTESWNIFFVVPGYLQPEDKVFFSSL